MWVAVSVDTGPVAADAIVGKWFQDALRNWKQSQSDFEASGVTSPREMAIKLMHITYLKWFYRCWL